MKRKLLLQMLAFSILSTTFISKSISQQTLIHYWHFNTLVNFTTTPVNTATLPAIHADYSIIDTGKTFILYRALPGTSSNYLSYWDNVAGDTMNARMSQQTITPGLGLRARNPSDSMQLLFYVPTTGYQNITIKYEVEKSSAGNGAPANIFDYSVDSGATWRTSGLSATVDSTGAGAWTFCATSINNDAAAYNNPKLVFRIRFAGSTNVGTSGNDRFDNFTFEGTPMPSGPPAYTISQINHKNITTGNPDSLNTHCFITGIVYGFNQATTGTQFLIRDYTGGITIFHSTKNFNYTVNEGDSIVTLGTVSVARGLTEFIPDTLIKVGSGKTLKIPTVITQVVDANQNDLVKISNLMFYTTPTGGVWPTASTDVLCHTQGQTDTVVVRVLVTSALAGAALPSSTLFSVTGIGTQISSSTSAPFASNGYKILPRTSADILAGLAPPDAVTNITSVPNLTSVTFTWTKPVTYSNANMTTLVFVKQGSAIIAGSTNKNPNMYSANTVFGSGTKYVNDTNARCVMNSDSSSVTITGLMQSTNYYVMIYSVRNTDSVYSTATNANATTTNNFPTQVTGLTVAGVTPTSTKISWTKPAVYNNTVHSTLVFVKATSAITAGTPTKGVSAYTANTVFGSGTAYQNDASAYCVYNGDSGFVTVSNLVQGTNYNVLVWVVRDGDSAYAILPTTGNGTSLPPPPVIKLIHYWNFNTFSTPYSSTNIPIANTLNSQGITADFSMLDTSKAKIYYRTFAGTSNAYLTYWDNVAGDTTNQKMGAIAGTGMRPRNPCDSMQLMFYIPTQHYKNIKVSYACEKSSMASAPYQQNFDYSLDAGKTWKTSGLNITFDSTVGIVYTPVYISFPNDTLTGNNPNLILRVKFVAGPLGIGSPTGLSGNDRFDNVAVEGDTTTATPQAVISVGINEVSINNPVHHIYPNPSSNSITIESNNTSFKNITITDITGKIIIQTSSQLEVTTIDISSVPVGLYFVSIIENDNRTVLKLIKN